MDPRLEKLKEEAVRLPSRGKFHQAEKAFTELTEAEPQNPRWHQKLGDVRRHLGWTDGAVEAFGRAADAYVKQGYLLRAMAMCKLILSLDPKNERIQATLQKLHEVPPDQMVPTALPQAQTTPGKSATDRSIPLSHQTYGGAPAVQSLSALHVPVETELGADEQMPDEPPPIPMDLDDEPPPLPPDVGELTPLLPPVNIVPPQPPPVVGDAPLLPPVGQEQAPAAESHSEAGGANDPARFKNTMLELMQDTPGPEPEEGVLEIPLENEVRSRPPVNQDGLASRLPPIPLLSTLSRHELVAFTRKVEVQQFETNEVIIQQGSVGDSLFILVEGTVAVVQEGPPRVMLWQLTEGAFFGEYALLTDLERSHTAQALTPCTVLSISRQLVLELVREHPPILGSLMSFFRDRMVGNLVHTHELFKPLSPEECSAVMGQFSWLEAQPDQVLVEAGQHPEGLYLLVAGHAMVHRAGRLQTPLRTGEMFCKTALMNGAASTHTVRTRTKCWLLRLHRGQFFNLIMAHPQVATVLSEARATGAHSLQELGASDREETLKVL